MADLVLRRGVGGEYLSIEHHPHRSLTAEYDDPEVWRMDWPAGIRLRVARAMYAKGIRPRPQQLKPSMSRISCGSAALFNESGTYKRAFAATREAVAKAAQPFSASALALIGARP